MRNNEKIADILALLILAMVVINWKTFFTISNIIVIVSWLLGTIYIFASMFKESAHYGLILKIVMIIEVVPAFLLIGKWYYTGAAIALIIFVFLKQKYSSRA